MRFAPRTLLGLALSVGVAAPGAAHEPPAGPTLAALAISEPITVDGVLDEPAWTRAAASSEFTQREPDLGQPATERTELRVVYTPTTLYIGLYCFDSEPGAIVARELQRDGRLFRDDSVIIVLDTFHDHRNAYFLETTPTGAILDSLVTDEGRSTNPDWDGVWEAASRVTADGWSTEMAIPFATLRFDPDLDTWGMNVRRLIIRKSEQAYWAQVGRDANLFRMSRAGHLTGLRGLAPGLNLRVKPFAFGSNTDLAVARQGADTEDSDLGVDVKWGITRGLSLDLTYNTDFAEVEVDEQQINLTRFSLFFDEKREFFLENDGIFEVVPIAERLGPPPLRLFHSRRIGIGPTGEEVPILWGARLTGRVGEWSVGAVGVATEATPLAGLEIPSQEWGVLRVKRNLGRRSTVGLIATERRGDDGLANRVYGIDADLNPLAKLHVNAFWSGSSDAGRPAGLRQSGADFARGAGATWSGPTWGWNADYLEIGEGFEPGVGFLLRNGVRRYAPRLTFQPRPALPGLRSLFFQAQGELFTDRSDTLLTAASRIDVLGFIFKTEDQVKLFAEIDYDRLTEPFPIRPGILIQEGEYDWNAAGVSYATNAFRKLFVSGSLSAGEFYDGDRLANLVTLGVRASRHFQVETTWLREDVELPGGSFTSDILRQRIGVAFTPRLFTNTFLQYNDSTELFSANVRFNWIYRPGANVFLVFNQNWDAPGLGELTRREMKATIKVTYLLER